MENDFFFDLKQKAVESSIDSLFSLEKNAFLIECYKEKRLYIYLNLNKKIISTIPLSNEERKIKLKKIKFNFRNICSPKIENIYFDKKNEILIVQIKDVRNIKWQNITYFIYIDFFEKNVALLDSNNKILKFQNKRAIKPFLLEEINKSKNNLSFEKYELDNKKIFIDSLNKSVENNYSNYLKEFRSKEKNLLKKIEISKKNIEDNKNYFIFKEVGDFIITNKEEIENLPKKNHSIKFNEIEYLIDRNKSPIENANFYFKKYKKSKSTLENSKLILEKFEKELFELKNSIQNIQNLKENKEPVLKRDNTDFGNKNKEHCPFVKYTFLNINYYLGKSKKDNDVLTFKSGFKKDKCTFMHLSDYSSGHLIVDSNIENNSRALEIGGSILLKNKGFKDGKITYTILKNVFKTKDPGKVILKDYKTFNLKQICQEVKNLK